MTNWRSSRPWLFLLATSTSFATDSVQPNSDFIHSEVITSVSFGSCLDYKLPIDVLNTIASANPNVFIFGGDTVYADTLDPVKLRNFYRQLEASAPFQKLRSKVKNILGVWDDHDYGLNDSGAENPNKENAKSIFWDFYRLPNSDPIRKRQGVYSSHLYGPREKRLQVILLDTRYHRSQQPSSKALPRKVTTEANYSLEGENVTLLGEVQWKWLEDQLKEPAELRFIVSSIEVLGENHPFEKWANFPKERLRFLKLLQQNKMITTVLLSGDRHFHQLSALPVPPDPPLYEFTSSGLNKANFLGGREDNPYRINSIRQNGFGWLQLDWPTRKVELRFVDESGKVSVWKSIHF